MELHKKPLLGLKTAPLPIFSDSDDDDSVFDDDSGTLPVLLPPPRVTTSIGGDSHKIKSFDDVHPRITQILNALEETKILPTKYTGEIFFIPEHIVSDEFSAALANYVNSRNSDAKLIIPDNLDILKLHINVKAQIDIVKYAKGDKINLRSYTLEQLEPRISSLVNYVLSKTDDHEKSCYYCTQSLLDLVKASTFAPISICFPDYSIKDLIHSLSIHLVKLFPHHPLLESVLHKFSAYDPSAPDALALIPDEDDDESDSFDDSFFSDIHTIQQQNKAPIINLFSFDKVIINPLDNNQPLQQYVVTITVNEPPSTLTYKFADGSTQLPPNLFTDWILSLNTQCPAKFNKPIFAESPSLGTLIPKQAAYLSAHTPNNMIELCDSSNSLVKDEPMNREATSEMLLDLLDFIGQPKKLVSILPNNVDPHLFALHLPLLHAVNSISLSPFKRGCIYPHIILNEFDAYQALKEENDKNLIKVINEIMARIPDGLLTEPLKPLAQKREFSKSCTTESPLIVAAISLSDVEIFLNGRSPFTLERISRDPIIDQPCPKKWRAEALYHIYSSELLPPYIAFRVAFAIALNLSDSSQDSTSFALDILFEALYGLLDAIPKMAVFECVRVSFLFFGEMLDRLDRYYYSALVLDAYFLGDTRCQTSNPIAPICQHKGDMVRAIFHFNQSMKYFVENKKYDEALYVSQVISQVYNDYGMHHYSISLLVCLLCKPYNLSVGRRFEKLHIKRTKTLPPVRRNFLEKTFDPKPSGTNTILCGISLADLFVKCKYFKMAKSLLVNMRNSTENKLYIRLIDFISLKRLIRKNKIEKFMSSLPPLVIRQRRSSSGSRLTLLSASTFDTVIASIKMLMNSALNRKLYGHAIFWSEVIINTQSKLALKDIGLAFLSRGEAFLHYIDMMNIQKSNVTVHISLDPIMASVGKYYDSHTFNSKAEIIAEAVSSFKAARLCFEKLGLTAKLITASILYASAILQHFVDDSEFNSRDQKNSTKDSTLSDSSDSDAIKIMAGENVSNQKFEINFKEEVYSTDKIDPLEIKNPHMETVSTGFSHPLVVSFEPYTISSSNVGDELNMLCQSIETTASRLMNPITIILGQVIVAKFNYFQKDIHNAKIRFEFAYTNFKKFFSCGGFVISHDFSIKILQKFHIILETMGHLLLHFNHDFINNHLIVFDWLSDVDSMLNNIVRVKPKQNPDPIDSTIDISMTALRNIASLKFPEFFDTISASHVEINESPPLIKDTIASCIVRICANIRLFETQKLKEDEMHENNRALCRQIESLAEGARKDHADLIPADTEYSYITRVSPIASQAIFVQKLYDAIYIYIPETGEKRRCQFTPSKPYSFSLHVSISNKKVDKVFDCSSGVFPPSLFEYLGQLLLPDRSFKHFQSSKCPPSKFVNDLKKNLFGHMNLKLVDWERVPDKIKFFHSKSLKGALSTIVTSPRPIIFVTSNDFRCIPFETIFSKQLVLRCWNFTQLLLPIKPPPSAVSVSVDDRCALNTILLRRRGDFEGSTLRSLDMLSNSISSCGGCIPSPQVVIDDDRSTQYMNPAFLSNKETTYYCQKYPFCSIFEKFNFPDQRNLDFHAMSHSKSSSKNDNNDNVINEKKHSEKNYDKNNKLDKNTNKSDKNTNKSDKNTNKSDKKTNKSDKNTNKSDKNTNKSDKNTNKSDKNTNKGDKNTNKINKNTNKSDKNTNKINKNTNKSDKNTNQSDKNISKNDAKNNHHFKQNSPKSTLFLFSYSDMCENHSMMRKLAQRYPSAFVMFIPGQVMKEALKIMKHIFERQKKRIDYVSEHKLDPELIEHDAIANVPFDFITAIQATLSDTLNCPIPLIAPTH
ncbi:hypothetical protein TRFO_16008 [Tritrichomonas foetus]|uniref:Uncharacterized protein n=1 Tax=Tritrichomonas foetus TaxID=1144522 RepID=A0A1J4KR69_9EUKA|nr:hypothetical protein TRFO_16008 [Tritrichomonas foetus]|eukprot:OHT13785.1 hypothetical protein TRFO_16008 [Tritrichomonas foetus]